MRHFLLLCAFLAVTVLLQLPTVNLPVVPPAPAAQQPVALQVEPHPLVSCARTDGFKADGTPVHACQCQRMGHEECEDCVPDDPDPKDCKAFCHPDACQCPVFCAGSH